MIAHSEWKHDNIFEGIAENGNTILFDADSAHTHGPSPMEAVLTALCGCTSVDVVSIVMQIERHYRIRLAHQELEHLVVVGELIDLIQSKVTPAASEERSAA